MNRQLLLGLINTVIFIACPVFSKTISQIDVNGNPAHPTRIIACYNDESRSIAISDEIKKLGLIEKERFKIAPGLRVFDEEQADKILSDNSLTEQKLSERLLSRIEALKKCGLFK